MNKYNSVFTEVLTVLFIGLKLTNNINWSWWWVLSPIWIMLGIAIIFFLIGVLIGIFKK